MNKITEPASKFSKDGAAYKEPQPGLRLCFLCRNQYSCNGPENLDKRTCFEKWPEESPSGRDADSPGKELEQVCQGTLDPFESLEACLTCHSRDWSVHHSDAWLYGIICGWDDAFEEVAEKHRWKGQTAGRLKLLRSSFIEAKRYMEHRGAMSDAQLANLLERWLQHEETGDTKNLIHKSKCAIRRLRGQGEDDGQI